MVQSEALQPDRLLLHASLLTSIAIGLVTFLTILSIWAGGRARKKAEKLNLERVQQWLSKRGLTPFPDSKRTSVARLLEHRMKHKNQEWDVTFANVIALPAALSVSLLGVFDEGQQLSMWADVVRTKEKVVEVQVTAAHPTLGKMGCTLSIQKLHLRFKVTVLEEGDGVSLSVQFLIPPNVTFRVTKKHPIEVTPSTVDSLTQCIQKEFTSLMLQNVPLLPSTPAGPGGSHGNGAVEESQPSQQPTSVTQLASHMSVDGCVSNHVEIVVTDTASAPKKNSVEEEETTSITPQGAVENEDTSSRTPNNSSTSSPAQPNNSWRRTHSYEKLDFTDVMPPPPAVTSPTRVFKHSTSVVASEHNGSLLEETGHMLDTPQKTQKKRPLSSMFPRSSLPSASGTTSESDAWSAVTESSEDVSLSSASDVSMIVYEFKDGMGMPKHVVVDKSSKPHIKRPPHSLKLHIYNGHTFVATHFKRFKNSVGPLTCSSCKKRVHGVVGKQAYQCRGCKMIVHKGCHSLVPHPCPQSTVDSMNLIYMDKGSTI